MNMFFHDKLWHDYLGFSCSPAKTLEEWSKKGGIIKDDKRNDLKSYKENDQCPEGALIEFTRKESIGTAWQERENRFLPFHKKWDHYCLLPVDKEEKKKPRAKGRPLPHDWHRALLCKSSF